MPEAVSEFDTKVSAPEVTAHVRALEARGVVKGAGDDDYLLQVVTTSPPALAGFLREELKSLAGIVRTRTTVALGTV